MIFCLKTKTGEEETNKTHRQLQNDKITKVTLFYSISIHCKLFSRCFVTFSFYFVLRYCIISTLKHDHIKNSLVIVIYILFRLFHLFIIFRRRQILICIKECVKYTSACNFKIFAFPFLCSLASLLRGELFILCVPA